MYLNWVPSGTMRFIIVSMSRLTSGSAFSLIVRLRFIVNLGRQVGRSGFN